MINNWASALCILLALSLVTCGSSAPTPRDALECSGVVEFEERVLSFEVPGRVATLPVERGTRVAAGALLATLDDTLQRAALRARTGEAHAAGAALELLSAGARREDVRSLGARVRAAAASEQGLARNLVRERALFTSGVTPKARVDDLDSELARARAERQALEQNLTAVRKGARDEELRGAEARRDTALAALELEEARLLRHRLHASHAGSVLDVHVEAGEVVAAGTPIASLADTSRPYVDVFVPVPDLGSVRLGAPARVRIDAVRKDFSGRVEHIAERTEFTPRYLFSERERPNLVVRVRVRVSDPRARLYAGVPAFVRLPGPRS